MLSELALKEAQNLVKAVWVTVQKYAGLAVELLEFCPIWAKASCKHRA